ncbi:MAG TPA: flagellar motor protein MotB [Firmicutes bacterium]|nr:flagellar motor protein MotB [Bacillota bacterium]
MAQLHEEEHEKENSERWLLTYADLITLLMAFFMVLYAMSQVDLQKLKKLGGSLSAALNTAARSGEILGTGTGKVFGTGTGGFGPAKVEIQRLNLEKVDPEFRAMAVELEQYRISEKLGTLARLVFDERGMVIQLDNSLLFPEGSATLTPEARRILDQLAVILKDSPNHVRVEGHTDDTPIHTDRYPSNWQLSTDRAANVIQYWVERCGMPPERLSAAGYGEYRPVAPNDTPAHRALNRRVEVVILRSSLTRYEPGGQPPRPPEVRQTEGRGPQRENR